MRTKILLFSAAIVALAWPRSGLSQESSVLDEPLSEGESAGVENAVDFPGGSVSRWNISAGVIFRDIGDVQFSTGPSLANPSFPFSDSFRLPPGVGPASGPALRTYSDGFVGPDMLGTTPNSAFFGTTSRYGFNSAAQNNNNQTLTFTTPGGGSQTTTATAIPSVTPFSSFQPSDYEPAIYMDLEYQKPVSRDFSAGFQFAFSWVNFDASNNTSINLGSQSVRTYDIGVIDAYNVPAGVNLPPAGYSQPLFNPPPAPLTRIFDSPTRTTTMTLTDTDQVQFLNSIEQQFDADFYTLSFGPELQYHCPRQTGIFATLSGGLALNIAQWDARQRERLVQLGGGGATFPGYVQYTAGDTDVVWGGYIQTGVGVRLGKNKNVTVQGFARWDWNSSLDVQVGPSHFGIDLDSFSAGATIGIDF